nr:lachesin-like [Cherax quadricarinatus]
MIRAREDEVWARLGASVNLSCVVDAFPEPSMVWLRDSGHPIYSHHYLYHLHHPAKQKYVSGMEYLNSTRWVISLRVSNVQEFDLLGYRCRANNSEGTAEARVAVFKTKETNIRKYISILSVTPRILENWPTFKNRKG